MTQPGGGFGMGSPPGGYGGSGGGYGGSGGSGGGDFGPSILGGGGPTPAGGGHRPSKKKGSGALIGLIVVAVLLVGAIVGVIVLVMSKKADGPIAADPSTLPAKQASIAYRHLPGGCDVVARGSLAQMMEVQAVKTHLVPIFDEMQANAAKDPDAKAVDELLAAAGIDAKKDIKDVAVCMKGVSLPKSEQKFLLVLGGDLRPESVVPAWEKVDARTTDKPVVTKTDGRFVGRLREADGETIIVGQGSDAAILVSNEEALFAGAVNETKSFETDYALPQAGEASIAVGASIVRDAMAMGGPNPFQKDINAITRVTGTASLAQARVELRLTTTSPQSAKSLLDVYNLILAPMMKKEMGQQKIPGAASLSEAKATVEGNDFVLAAQGTPADVDAAARELARVLREERAKGKLSL
ncbi:MAG: hypothetical protein R3F14_34625 [Polyangiaceae bacterium]